jgi:hypothetical protein
MALPPPERHQSSSQEPKKSISVPIRLLLTRIEARPEGTPRHRLQAIAPPLMASGPLQYRRGRSEVELHRGAACGGSAAWQLSLALRGSFAAWPPPLGSLSGMRVRSPARGPLLYTPRLRPPALLRASPRALLYVHCWAHALGAELNQHLRYLKLA